MLRYNQDGVQSTGVGQSSGGGGSLSSAGSEYFNGSPYRVQRHAANIRERKRMLRSAIGGPNGYT